MAAMIASALLPIDMSHAGFLSDLFKGSTKQTKPTKSAAPAKHAASSQHASSPKHAASPKAKPAAPPKIRVAEQPPPAKPAGHGCEPAKFRIVLDVGHTAKSEGAMSARNVPEFNFNLHLAERIEGKLKSEGFAAAKLMVTEGKARPSLATRVAAANNSKADLLLSIHHDS